MFEVGLINKSYGQVNIANRPVLRWYKYMVIWKLCVNKGGRQDIRASIT